MVGGGTESKRNGMEGDRKCFGGGGREAVWGSSFGRVILRRKRPEGWGEDREVTEGYVYARG